MRPHRCRCTEQQTNPSDPHQHHQSPQRTHQHPSTHCHNATQTGTHLSREQPTQRPTAPWQTPWRVRLTVTILNALVSQHPPVASVCRGAQVEIRAKSGIGMITRGQRESAIPKISVIKDQRSTPLVRPTNHGSVTQRRMHWRSRTVNQQNPLQGAFLLSADGCPSTHRATGTQPQARKDHPRYGARAASS